VQWHLKTPINMMILRVDIILGREKRKTQTNYMINPKEPQHYKHIWSSSDYYCKPLDWCEQESKYDRKMKIFKAKKVKYGAQG
jgi:hypothetical protein